MNLTRISLTNQMRIFTSVSYHSVITFHFSNKLLSDSKLGNPSLWSLAYQSLQTATPGYSLHPHLIDFYLLQEWYLSVQRGRNGTAIRRVYYLDRLTVTSFLEGNNCDSIHNAILVPDGDSIRKLPILFLHTKPGQTKPFLVILDYSKLEVFVFCQHPNGGPVDTNMHACWKDWNGDQHWKAIGGAFGWEVDERHPKVVEPNWGQVSLYCYQGQNLSQNC